MKKVAHLLLTRFNLLRRNSKGMVLGAEYDKMINNWDYRLDIFRRYCLPSIKQQVNINFRWFWYVDTNTPTNLVEQLRNLPVENLDVVIVKSNGISAFPAKSKSDILTYISDKYTHIITTRLDNDDLLQKNTMHFIYNKLMLYENAILDLRKGFQMLVDSDQHKISNDLRSFNPFISRIEPLHKASGIYEREHRKWKTYPTVLLDYDEPRWIQLIHGENLLNSWLNGLSAYDHFEPSTFGLNESELNIKDYTSSLNEKLKYRYQEIAIRFTRY